ncbi:hypothetical protein ACNFH5_09675 [Pseudomonas sp. NY15435]|uniref:hypothetical protein n=1 Tax=Pseudomonas sp. NY15435 TaxID=3400358 RepID=UPI003A84F68B
MHAISRSQRMERMSEYLNCETARSLELLRQIDGTVEALVLLRRQMDALSEAFGSLLSRFNNNPPTGPIPEDVVVPTLEESQDSLRKMHAELARRSACAKADTVLTLDDGVVDAYEQAIDAVISLNQVIEQTRWALLEHNADSEGSHEPHVLRSDEEIEDFIRAL